MLPLHPSLKMNVQNMIKITFPDDSVREYAEGTTAMQIAESISSRLAQDVLAASVNGEIWDLTRPITSDSAVKLFKWDDAEGKHAFWHSSAHLMAEALQELFPGTNWLRARRVLKEKVSPKRMPSKCLAIGEKPIKQS